MSENTKIEWTDATWNPITGCSVVSAGCKNCYAMKLAGTRLQHHPSRAGLTVDTKNGPVWTGEVRFNEQWLDQPLRWKRPRMVFVCAHSDLFHESVPDEWIDRVLTVTAHAKQHVFQILTKRPKRMRSVMKRWTDMNGRPQQNLWLGVSVEDQATADERIPLLLKTPAAVRWISAEPLLGQVDIPNFLCRYPEDEDGAPYPGRVDWVVLGGESGPNARPMYPDWARSLRDQCADAGVPFLFKQHGEWISDEDIDNCNLRAPEIADADQYFKTLDWPNGSQSYRVGKKSAGRLLDGVQHDGYPGGVA